MALTAQALNGALHICISAGHSYVLGEKGGLSQLCKIAIFEGVSQ
jgi:hypothetical protein